MSGGPVCIGIGDDVKGPRLRHDALIYAGRHQGKGIQSAMTQSNRRPHSAPTGIRRDANPLPGFQNLLVGTQLSTVPRVKPEAYENARRASGAGMAALMSQELPNRAFVEPVQPEYEEYIDPGPVSYSTDKVIAVINPRIKPEAEDNAVQGHMGAVGKMFHESYDEARRKNIENGMRTVPKPKNHIQANIQRMRQIQKKAKANERNKKTPTPVKALWRSGKYASVEPRVAIDNTWQRAPTRNAPRPSTAPSKSRDFVAKNARKAWHPENKLKRTQVIEHIGRVNEQKQREQELYDLEIRGTVPAYLQKRKNELQQIKNDEYANAHRDPQCPPGHVQLSEDERRKILDNLHKSLADFEGQLATLPVRQCDSLAYKHRKASLEKQISELDEAVKTFSKKKVFVQQ